MDFRNPGAQVYVPDGATPSVAVSRTTHLAIGAHQDDIPIMAYDGILQCFGRDDRWFLGVTVTDGSGSPRAELYADYTDEQMRTVRAVEENKAAFVGEYSAAIQLDYPSAEAKKPSDGLVRELANLVAAAAPEVVYTHNLADKHDTHVGVALRTLAAIRSLPGSARPEKLYGCEVWRDLDWMNDEDKVVFDVSVHGNLAAALIGVYDSQIAGGKRYDLATEGRRLAHATYSASHAVDSAQALIYGMDLTPLLNDDEADVSDHVAGHIRRMQEEISDRIDRLS
ncbi:MAG: PIG-L family deacetylase [Acidimicrobiia bacterium]|nr:PIG-L family deacetylase [Acidimicrobiia bacterium]